MNFQFFLMFLNTRISLVQPIPDVLRYTPDNMSARFHDNWESD